ncbi:hypothetical protein J2T20_005007 [Paenibacillus wynnii]|nr:hypothetical protein [Paenibacillus wynnii]
MPGDLTPFGGPENGFFDNYSIQEVDLETDELLFDVTRVICIQL